MPELIALAVGFVVGALAILGVQKMERHRMSKQHEWRRLNVVNRRII